MQIKKNPNAALENYSKILILLGLVLSLFLVYEFINIKSYPRELNELKGTFVSTDNTEEIIEIDAVEPIEQKQEPKTITAENIMKVQDEIEVEESLLESTEMDVTDAVEINVEEEVVSVEEEEEVIEDVPFVVIENVPVFPGCKGTNKELRACFSNQINKFVSKNFNANIASEIGLDKGSIQKIFVMFKIDSKGYVTDIKARAPHKRLQDEAIRVINLLPAMTPGSQRGRPVGVKYGLPIVFKVE